MEGGPNIQERDSTNNSLGDDQPGLAGGCNFFCHPKGTGHRFIALIFMCFLGFGSYFCYDNPAALQNYFQKDLNLTVSEYTMMYSVYSWPNVILCFIGGVLIDRVFGIRLGATIYMGLTMLGHLGFATGVFFNQYWLILLGRFIFGIGGESLAVAQNNYAVLWFKGKELNMVFGLQLSFARVGSTVNFMVMEPVYAWVSGMDSDKIRVLGIVLYMAGVTCILSMLCSIVLGFLDKRAERILRRASMTGGEGLRMMNVRDFNISFWLITVICVSYYVAIFPFMSLAKEFFVERFKFSNDKANDVCSVLYIVSGVVSPILGFLIDKTGKNVTWIFVAILFTMLSHVLMAFTMLSPFVGMVTLGIAYSALASSLWPLVSLIIPEHELGTAYGVCQAVQNLGLAVVAIIAGMIVEHYSYTALEIFFLVSLTMAMSATASLWFYNKMKKGILDMTPGQRATRQRSQLAAEILEREKLLAAVSNEYLQPDSDFYIGNSNLLPVS